MTNINYSNLVTTSRLAARDVLRSEKVSALLGYIRNVNAKISDLRLCIEQANHYLSLDEYEFNVKAQFNHPDLARLTEVIEAKRKKTAEQIEDLEKNIKDQEAKIAEYNTKIENWQTDVSKVDYDAMCALALSMIQERVGSEFNKGVYDEVVNTSNQ